MADKIKVDSVHDHNQIDASEYQSRVLNLLAHLETILPDAVWATVDTKLWNDVSTADPEIVYSE